MKRIKISNMMLFALILLSIMVKVIFYIAVKTQFVVITLGGGNDADYYDAFANGYITNATSIWPIILEKLNNWGLYLRSYIAYFLFILNTVYIPLITAKIANLSFSHTQKLFLTLILIILIYPTLYFYSFDVYRDLVMVTLFLIGAYFTKNFIVARTYLKKISNLFMAVAIGWLLVLFRPYLGFAFLGSLLFWSIKFTKRRVIFLLIVYFIALFVANYLGLLDSLIDYRGGFGEDSGGSTLGLNFSNPIMFLPNFVLSILGQMFGLFITNPFALLIFIIETIPFLIMLKYVVKNVKLADGFVRYLLIFFVLYGSIWLIGNDNLGTAIRLRIYNYFAIYICYFYLRKMQLTLQR